MYSDSFIDIIKEINTKSLYADHAFMLAFKGYHETKELILTKLADNSRIKSDALESREMLADSNESIPNHLIARYTIDNIKAFLPNERRQLAALSYLEDFYLTLLKHLEPKLYYLQYIDKDSPELLLNFQRVDYINTYLATVIELAKEVSHYHSANTSRNTINIQRLHEYPPYKIWGITTLDNYVYNIYNYLTEYIEETSTQKGATVKSEMFSSDELLKAVCPDIVEHLVLINDTNLIKCFTKKGLTHKREFELDLLTSNTTESYGKQEIHNMIY